MIKFKNLLIFILLMPIITLAQTLDEFGLGIVIGQTTGISAKKWFSDKIAIDFALGWDLEGDDSITFYGDLLTHRYNTFAYDETSGRLPFYYGIGCRFHSERYKSKFGVRMPLGANYPLENSLDLFLEIVPILELISKTEFELSAGLGIRYFFK